MSFQKYLETIIESKTEDDTSSEFESAIKKIAAATDENRNTHSWIILSTEILKDKKLAEAFQNLQKIQNYFGNAPTGLQKLRDELGSIAKEQAIKKFGDRAWKKIYSAF